jgi:hypothetical protein
VQSQLIAQSSGGFFFVWTLLALGVTALFSVILSVRGLWSLQSGQVPVVLPGEGKCKEIATAGSDLRGGGRPLLQQTFSRVVDAAEKSL